MYRRMTALFASVLVMALALTWVFLSMRAVMDVGGACASGGAYEIATPCPDHVAVFMTLGIPLMILCAFIGSWIAVSLGAPDLLIPMWLFLFGSLGWNFLEYGFGGDDLVWGWIVCGVMFELMALPALLFLLPWGNNGPVRLNPQRDSNRAKWLLAYAALGLAGIGLGWATYVAWN